MAGLAQEITRSEALPASEITWKTLPRLAVAKLLLAAHEVARNGDGTAETLGKTAGDATIMVRLGVGFCGGDGHDGVHANAPLSTHGRWHARAHAHTHARSHAHHPTSHTYDDVMYTCAGVL